MDLLEYYLYKKCEQIVKKEFKTKSFFTKNSLSKQMY